MPHNRHRRRLPLVLRSVALIVLLAAAPTALGADPSPVPSPPVEPAPTPTPTPTPVPVVPTPVPIPPVPSIPPIPPRPAAEPAPGAPDVPTPVDSKTSTELAEDLAEAEAEQEELARQLAEQQRQVAELQSLQNQLQSQIDQTAASLDAITADLTSVRAEIAVMIQRITQVKAKYDGLVAELARLDNQLANLIERESAKRIELRDRQALLAERMRAAYEADQTSLLEVFLSGGAFSDFLAEVSYHLDIGLQDKALAERIQLDQETLRTLRESIELTRTQTNLVRQATAVQKRELDAELLQLEATKKKLADLEALTARELENQRTTFADLSSSREDLEAAIAEAQRAQKETSASISRLVEAQALLGHIPSEYNGTFIWPLVARVSQEWGCTAFEGYGPGGPGCLHYHNGIDIVDACGAEIRAAGDGVVAYADWNWADGLDPAFIVVVAHSTNVKTWYAHLQPPAAPGIRQGALVKAGDVIGYEGNTGRSTGCHLHWMVELNGEFVNPRLFL